MADRPKVGDVYVDGAGKKSIFDGSVWKPVGTEDTTRVSAPATPTKEAQEEGKAVLGGTKKSTFAEAPPKPPAADAGLTEQAKYQKAKREWERRRAAAGLTAGKQAEAVK